MPIVLPITSPRMTPHVTRCDNASPSSPVGMWMPALASANSGTTTNADHGCRRCSNHSTTDTDDCACRRDAGGVVRRRLARASSSASIETRLPCAGCHRCEQAEGHPGERRVDVRLVQRQPAQRAEREVDTEHVVDLVPRRQPRDDQRRHRRGQPLEGHAFGVEDGDHDDGADVVGDRQRQQEQLEPRRRTRARAWRPRR